jgi:hypothetical protein
LNASFSIPIILLVVPAALAIYLLIVGRRRRIGTEAHCRKCNYLLHGIDSDRCPECGPILDTAGIVRGEWQRRLVPFVFGWLIVGGLAVFLAVGGFSAARNINWYHYKPTHFVLKDLKSQNAALSLQAWDELVRRDGAGSLSAAARNELVVFALAQQRWITSATGCKPAIFPPISKTNFLSKRFALRSASGRRLPRACGSRIS